MDINYFSSTYQWMFRFKETVDPNYQGGKSRHYTMQAGKDLSETQRILWSRGVQPFGISGP